MDVESLDVLNIFSDEFKFLDNPTYFLSKNCSTSDFDKSIDEELDDNLKELISESNEAKKNKNDSKPTYLEDLNDLKELKKIEDKNTFNLFQKNLDRISRINFNEQKFSLTPKLDRLNIYKNLNKLESTFTLDSKSNLANSTFDVIDLELNDNEKTFIIKEPFNTSLSDKHLNINGSFTIAKNYDEVQEIARKQEEALKKNAFVLSSINNATITKIKKNGFNKQESPLALKNCVKEEINQTFNSDVTFNLGKFLDNNCQSNNSSVNNINTATINKKLPNQKSFVLNQKNAFLTVKKNPSFINKIKNTNLDSRNNQLNQSFVIDESNPLDDKDLNNTFVLDLPNEKNNLSKNQFQMCKNKPNKNLKRTNTFKVREFQCVSEENLNLNFSKNIQGMNFIKNGLAINNYNQSVDDMRNYETIKLNQRKVNKLNSKSNGNINTLNTEKNKFSKNILNSVESNENLNDGMIYKTTKLPAFTSRLKAPSRKIILKSEEI